MCGRRARRCGRTSPHLTPLADGAAGAEEIACGYPLIHRSNTGPWHFIHGFTRFLAETLGVAVEPGGSGVSL